jgi:hypothetical protein
MGTSDGETGPGPTACDRVPRTADEEASLLSGQQPGWEYLLWGAVLLRGEGAIEPKWREHKSRARRARGQALSDQESVAFISDTFSEVSEIVSRLDQLFTPETQEKAFGKPGEAGDPEHITSFAEGVTKGYGELLEWSAGLRADGVPDALRTLFDDTSDLVDRPLEQIRAFIDDAITQLDAVPAALRNDQQLSLSLTMTLSVDNALMSEVTRELGDLPSRLGHPGSEQRGSAGAAPTSSDSPEASEGTHKGFFANRRAKKEAQQHQDEFATWQATRDAYAENLALAQSFNGDSTADGFLLKPGETVFATVNGASLVEDRRGAGEWKGHSHGVSVPVGSIHGRSIRYRVGQSRGHYVQGAPVPTAIDVGTLYVTNQRVVFKGAKQSRECLFAKMIGYEHTPDGTLTISVSNRQKATTINYGEAVSGWVDFRFDLALAHFQGQLDQIVAQAQSDLATVDAEKPTD